MPNKTNEEKFFNVYELAKKYGDKFPEVVAAQYALETSYGTKMKYPQTNNVFNQTTLKKNGYPAFKGKDGTQFYWQAYDSVEDAVKARATGKWSKMYGDAKDPITAMASVQSGAFGKHPAFAPNDHGNQHYMKSIAGILKQAGYYEGPTDIPNGDVDPDYYKNSEWNQDKRQLEFDEAYQEKTYNDYKQRKAEINKEPNQTYRDIKLKELNKEQFDKGHINSDGSGFLNERFDKEQADYDNFMKGETPGGFVHSLVQNDKVKIKRPEGGRGAYTMEIDGSAQELDSLDAKIKKFLPKGTYNIKRDNVSFGSVGASEAGSSKTTMSMTLKGTEGNSLYKLLKVADDEYLNLEGENLYFKPEILKNKDGSVWNDNQGNAVGYDIPIVDKLKSVRTSQWKENQTIAVDPEWLKRTTIPDPKEKDGADGAGGVNTKTVTNPDGTTTTEGEDPATSSNDLEDFLNQQITLNGLGGQKFNYEKGKGKVNIDALSGFALGIYGKQKAENVKIPLRTEEVDQAMKNYMADIKQKSELGLPAEIEAAMKSQLADAYQGGLENIVNASAGNRATVLGNLGSLEQAKNKGLVAIQVADYEAKDRAFAQYGQALEYVNSFNANRDIANHNIKYQEAKQTQQDAQQLGAAGFGKLMDALKYDRDFGPGSINDMYRSMSMQHIFGFDPKMPDDGKGTTWGTKSAYEASKIAVDNLAKQGESILGKFNELNPSQKEAVNAVFGEVKDAKKVEEFIDYVKENPNEDYSKYSTENLDKAMTGGDWSVLSKARASLSTANATAEKVQENQRTNPTQANPVMDSIFKDTTMKPQVKNGDVYSNTQDEINSLWPSRNARAGGNNFQTNDPGFQMTDDQLKAMGGNPGNIDPGFLIPSPDNIDPGFDDLDFLSKYGINGTNK